MVAQQLPFERCGEDVPAAGQLHALPRVVVFIGQPVRGKPGHDARRLFVGGLAISAIATPRPVYATPVYSGSCYIARRPVTNGWGDVIGYRNVRVCD